jgi:hypothetical protein
MGHYQDANECFSEIPSGHRLYNDSLNAKSLTSRFQDIDQSDGPALGRIRQDFDKEFNKLFDITIGLATGKLQ